MNFRLTELVIKRLESLGVSTLLLVGSSLPRNFRFESPCSIKWMQIQRSIEMGAFSYAVSGYYFACEIGRYCSIGENVQIGRHGHPMHYFSTSPFFYAPASDVLDSVKDFGESFSPNDFLKLTPPVEVKVTKLGHDVWVGHGAFILPGVTIGTGAVVAAHSVVTKDVPPYALVAGAPATVKRFRFNDQQISLLLESEWWKYAPSQLCGVHMENIDRFFEFVSDLRLRKAPLHKGKIVTLDDLDVKDA
jgi:acetyltransferase-like isoleucine patch superfamily enzyme